MAYATDDDRKYLAERGFLVVTDGFFRSKDGANQMISPAWLGQRKGDLSTPGDGNNVRWTATSTRYKKATNFANQQPSVGIPYVSVAYADGCMDPTTAFITAEIRNWERPHD